MSTIKGHKTYLSKLLKPATTFTDFPLPLPYEKLEEAKQHQELLKEQLRMVQELFDELLGNSNLTDEDQENFASYSSTVRKSLTKLKHKISSSKNTNRPQHTHSHHQHKHEHKHKHKQKKHISHPLKKGSSCTGSL